ncbi:MAG: hypothetical protein ACM3QU_02475 [Verrucomicrobiota bacterium]
MTIAARILAVAGAVLAIVGVFLDALAGVSYWNLDGTLAWAGIVLGAAALLMVAASFVGAPTDGWLFAIGAVLVGYWGWLPAALAFSDLDQAKIGAWLCIAGAVAIAAGAAVVVILTQRASTTPRGISLASVLSLVGIALVYPAIFLHVEQDQSYWDGPFGLRFFGILMLALTSLCAAAWVATAIGRPTRGLDAALTLVLLGLVAFDPVDKAFNRFGDLQVGGWLALAGGILAAGGTWSARAAEAPRPTAETTGRPGTVGGPVEPPTEERARL